jgi:UDP-2,3-diacylglucosamine hydrolase
MALYLFSDAHLGSASDEKEAEKVAKISQLCDRVKADGDRLIILGDLFDFWFEYKHAMPKEHFGVLVDLQDVIKSGVQVDYVSGNHDFWMDDFFETRIGIAVHRDRLDLEYQGRRLHLIHGDGLAGADRGYRLLKRILRNRFNIWLYRKLPPDWAIPLAKFVSGSSRDYTSQRDHGFVPDYEAYAKTKLREGFDIVIIGHLHIPSVTTIDGGMYINSGDFINHFSYVRVDENGARLEYLD